MSPFGARRPRVRRVLALAPVAALLTSAAVFAQRRVDVTARDLPCANRRAAMSAAERLIDRELPPGESIKLEIATVAADRLRVRTTHGGARFEREIPFRPEDCSELPETLALIVWGWHGARWRAPAEAPSFDAATAAAAAPQPRAPREPPPLPTLPPVRVESAERAAPHLDEAEAVTPDRQLARPAARAEPAVTATSPAATAVRPPPWFHLAGAAGAFAGMSGETGAQLAVTADVDAAPGLWLGGDFGWEAPSRTRANAIAVRTEVLRLGPSLRAALVGGSSGALSLLACAGLSSLRATGEGLRVNATRRRGDAFAALALRWDYPLARAAALSVQFRALARAHNEIFTSDDGQAITLSPLRISLTAGLVWSGP